MTITTRLYKHRNFDDLRLLGSIVSPDQNYRFITSSALKSASVS